MSQVQPNPPIWQPSGLIDAMGTDRNRVVNPGTACRCSGPVARPLLGGDPTCLLSRPQRERISSSSEIFNGVGGGCILQPSQ